MASRSRRLKSVLLAKAGHSLFLVGAILVGKERQLPQQVASRDRFPRHVFGNGEANDVAGSGNILQKPNDLVWCHPPTWNIGQGVSRCVWLVKQNRTKFRWVEHIHIEMNRELSNPFVCNPIQHWRRSVG
jgi:hypothetical protein